MALHPENFQYLRTIETAICVVTLDDANPTSEVEVSSLLVP